MEIGCANIYEFDEMMWIEYVGLVEKQCHALPIWHLYLLMFTHINQMIENPPPWCVTTNFKETFIYKTQTLGIQEKQPNFP